MQSAIRIALVGDLNQQQKAHAAIPRALAASSDSVESVWVPTDSVANGQSLAEFDGIWCVPGMPYRSAEGAMRAIRHARMSKTPFLGTSAGFQYAIIEFARNVLGISDADHQKSNPKAAVPLISPLGCALAGAKAKVHLAIGSRLQRAYGTKDTVEEYHCSFGFNGRYRRLIEGSDLTVAAVDDQNEIRAIEVDGHPFFVATLFQPEMRVGENPVTQALVAVCVKRKQGLAKVAS